MEEQSERTIVYPKVNTAGAAANFTVRDLVKPVGIGRARVREIVVRATDHVRASTDVEADPDREITDGAIGRCPTIVVGVRKLVPLIKIICT